MQGNERSVQQVRGITNLRSLIAQLATFAAVTLFCVSTVDAQITILDEDFEDPNVNTGAQGTQLTYTETPAWDNLAGDPNLDFIRLSVSGSSSTQDAVITDAPDREGATSTGYSLALGDLLDFSYVWRDAFQWDDNNDRVALTFYTTDDNTVTGNIASSYQFLSATSTSNNTYEVSSGSQRILSSADVGKTLFVSINGNDGGMGADGFARLDDLLVQATAGPSTLFIWATDADGSWNGPNWSTSPAIPNAADADVFFAAENITTARTVTVDSSATANTLNFFGSNQYTLATAGGQSLTLAESSGGAADAAIEVASGLHEISGSLAGSVGFEKTGDGNLRLSGSNPGLTGGITISAGDIRTNNTAGLGSNAVSIASGSFLYLEGTADPNTSGYTGTFNNTVTGSGEIRTGEFADAAEVITIGTGLSGFDGILSVRGGATVVNSAADLGTAAAPTWINTGSGELRLDGSGGNLTIGETFNVGSRGGTDAPHIVNTAGNNTITVDVNGVAGDGNHVFSASSGSTLTFNDPSGSVTIADSNDNGTFVFQGEGNFVIGNASTAGSGKITSDAPNTQPAAVNVLKQGSGNLTIATASNDPNDYWGGTTTIEGGTLTVLSNGSNNGELASSNIALVDPGTEFDVKDFGEYTVQIDQTISGVGTIDAGSNTLRVVEASTISPGNSVGTLNVTGNLTFQYFDTDETMVPNTGKLVFELGDTPGTVGGTENDLLAVAGNLTINAATPGTDQFRVEVVPVEGVLGTGAYSVVSYTGSLGGNGSASNFNPVATDAEGNELTIRQTLSMSTDSDSLNVVVSGSAGNLFYNSGDWDLNSTVAWATTDGGGATQTYFDLDAVTFTDNSASKSVNLASDVYPGSITINNSAGNDYTFSGEGAIVGSTGITKQGTGTAILANSVDPNGVTPATNNTFSGNVDVQGGTLVFASPNPVNAGDMNVAGGATLQIGNGSGNGVFTDDADGALVVNGTLRGNTGSGNEVVARNMTGSGAVEVTSGGLAFSGDNSGFTGTFTANGGEVRVLSLTGLGNPNSATPVVTATAGGQIELEIPDDGSGTITLNKNYSLSGNGAGGTFDAALKHNTNDVTYVQNGTISLAGDASLRTDAQGAQVDYNGAISGTNTDLTFNIGNNSGSGTTIGRGSITNVDGGISLGTGGLNVIATGTPDAADTEALLNLNSANTYSGDTSVGEGGTGPATVMLNNAGALGSTSNIKLGEQGELRVANIGGLTLSSGQNVLGAGTVTGNLSAPSGSSVSPGGTLSTFDVEVSTDTRIQEGDPNTNWNSERLAVGLTNNDGIGRGLLDFDLAGAVPAAVTVVGGELLLDVGFAWGPAVAQTVTIEAYELDTAFAEGTATWNSASTGVSWTTAGGDFDPNAQLGASGNLNPAAVQGTDVIVVAGDALDAAVVANASSSSFDLLLKLDDASEAVGPTEFNAIWLDSTNSGPNQTILRLDVIDPTSTLTIDGDYSQSAGATLEIDLLSDTDFDVLSVTGALTAGGTLDVDYIGGGSLMDGDVFDILEFDPNTVSGSFTLDLPALTSGLQWNTSSLLTTGEISVTSTSLSGDFNGDGRVDGQDFLLWQRNPAVGSLTDWENGYNLSLSTNTSSVPEPGAFTLLLGSVLLSLATRRTK